MKFAIVSLYTKEIEQIGKIMEENRIAYAKRHSYDFVCAKQTLDPTRHPVWSKLLILKKVIEEGRHDWVMWTDADSLIVNPKVPLETFTENIPEYVQCIVTADRWTGFNAGQMFFRCNSWSRLLLARAYERRDCINHFFREQQALLLEIQNADFKAIHWAEKRLFNSYLTPFFGHQLAADDFLIHFASLKGNTLLRLMHYFHSDPNAMDKFLIKRQVLQFVQVAWILMVLWIVKAYGGLTRLRNLLLTPVLLAPVYFLPGLIIWLL